ncbi:MAG: methylenetetrahydrofolate reductase [Clostridia bacterium]|nr:methylenetetrahydrofolate reductase [Clostridia bacterium]
MKTNELFGLKPVFSAEVFPPKRSGNLEGVIRALKGIQPLHPDYVSITYGAGGDGAETTADVASIAKDAFDIETVAHMTCVNMTLEKLENQIEILKRKSIENILVLRGDITENSKFYEFKHANELAFYIKSHYPEFNLLGACYPEKHPEAKSIDEDIDNLKRKIDAGVSMLVTQLFFDNDKFLSFRDKVRAKGIFVPIEAGIMPIFNHKMVEKTVRLSSSSIPCDFEKILAVETDEELYDKGIKYILEQCLRH